MKRAFLVIGCIAMTILLAAACSAKKRPPQPPIPPPAETLPAMPPQQSTQPQQPPSQPQPPPQVTQQPAPTLNTIHFDFDKYDIRPGDAKTLDANAAYLRDNATVKITLEGYTDPIGTDEYNRGLGLRRANSAKAYLVKLGLDPTRFTTISYGKEKLVTTDSTQYELNRRVEFKPQ
jgi:peptidoglycan-associated lipoprotein